MSRILRVTTADEPTYCSVRTQKTGTACHHPVHEKFLCPVSHLVTANYCRPGQKGHTTPMSAIGRDADRVRVSVIVRVSFRAMVSIIVTVLTNAGHCTGVTLLTVLQ